MESYQEILDDLEKKYYSYFESFKNLNRDKYKLFENKKIYYIVEKLLLPMTYEALTKVYCRSDWNTQYFIDYYNKQHHNKEYNTTNNETTNNETEKSVSNLFIQTFSDIIEKEYRKIEFKLYDTIYQIDYMNDFLNYISYEIKRSTYNILYSKYHILQNNNKRNLK